MRRVDNLIRCQIAMQYSDDEGYMFVPGHFDEDLEFHPVWEKAVKGFEAPDGWYCVGAFGTNGDFDSAVRAVVAADGGIPNDRLENNYS